MKHYIEHKEFVNLYNKDSKIFDRIFNDTHLFSTLITKITKESKKWEKFSYTEKQGEYKMVGDLYEIFGEGFLKILGCDNRVGISNYKPEQDEDCGVDGSGLGMNNRPLTVQIKFRSNNEKELTQGDLNQFAFQSQNRFGVKQEDKDNMVVFTSAKGLHYFTEGKVFLNKIRTIGYEDIRGLVDNNYPFWNAFKDYIKETIKQNYE